MSGVSRLANEAWEALFRAQVVLMRKFSADDVWVEVSQAEYDVLYTLSKAKRGLSMVEINNNILMTQGGVSRLVHRLESRGLLARTTDPRDRRATVIELTDEGRQVQRAVGRRHAAAVTAAMTAVLDHSQMEQIRDLGRQIVTKAGPSGGLSQPSIQKEVV